MPFFVKLALIQCLCLIRFCLVLVSQFEKLEGIPELGAIVEQTEREGAQDERLGSPESCRDVGTGIPLLSPERHQQQVPTPDRRVPRGILRVFVKVLCV